MVARTAARFPLFAAAVPWAIAILVWVFMIRLGMSADFGTDAHAYWLTSQVEDLYRTGPATKDAYLYSPAFAQVIWPLTHVDFWVFYGLWVAAELAVLVWLVRPLAHAWALLVAALCYPELIIGNIYIFMAGALVVAMRHPAMWAFLVLTKVTPGIPSLYFVFTRQWRKFAVAVLATVGVALLSAALDWHLWIEWIEFSRSHSTNRAILATQALASLVLVAVAAWLRRPWLLAVAVFVSAPVMTTPAAGAILAAIPRLRSSHRSVDRAEQPLLVERNQ